MQGGSELPLAGRGGSINRMNNFIKIDEVKPAGSQSLLVVFSNGETRVVDYSRLIAEGGIWSALADPEIFAQVKIDEYSRGVEWPNGADSCADAMYERSIALQPVAGR